MENFKVLYIDDDQRVISRMRDKLETFNLPIELIGAESGETAIKLLEHDPRYSVLIIDMYFGEDDCLGFIDEVSRLCPSAKKYVNSNDATQDSMRKVFGKVEDYFDKSRTENETELILKIVKNYQEFLKEQRRGADIKRETRNILESSEIITRSPLMIDEILKAKQYAETKFPILITGETGVGKEVFSKFITKQFNHVHKNKAEKFVVINCAAFNNSEGRLESELFGHVKGSFTGADVTKKGLFETGSGGTILMDEIDKLSRVGQVKILRALEEKKIRPVGSNVEVPFDARFIFTAKSGIEQLVENGEFLNDLLGRIDVLRIKIPPLRHRLEDIPLLLSFFAENQKDQIKGLVKSFTDDAIEYLMDYDWSRNVRELESVYSQVATLTGENLIVERRDVEIVLKSKMKKKISPMETPELSWKKIVEDRTLLKAELERHKFNQSSLAREWGIARNTMHYWVSLHKLTKRDLQSSNAI